MRIQSELTNRCIGVRALEDTRLYFEVENSRDGSRDRWWWVIGYDGGGTEKVWNYSGGRSFQDVHGRQVTWMSSL